MEVEMADQEARRKRLEREKAPMSESAGTPRTDAKAYMPFEDDMNEQVVNAEFARTLERELRRTRNEAP
jgi:hypothetical protein